MKIDLSGNNSRFTQRALASFSGTMFDLLQKKRFEDISVNEICKISN